MKYKNENIYFDDIQSLPSIVDLASYSKVFVLCDENTNQYCWPKLQPLLSDLNIKPIVIPAGEKYKILKTCESVWQYLLENKADRASLLINLGGGVVGDLGGFCAAVYMRGMHFIQIPTTLLAQVDASVGGKTGVDFHHYKNIVGAFVGADATIIDSQFLDTLPIREFDNGFVEIWKHAFIADKQLCDSLAAALATAHKSTRITQPQVDIKQIIKDSVAIKQNIVENDPFERGYRKALNFGHTVGHAFENLALSQHKDIKHGEAVAFGIMVASRLSMEYSGLSTDDGDRIDQIIAPYCHLLPNPLECDRLIELLKSDKKHRGNQLQFTLLDRIGRASVNHHVSEASIKSSILQTIGTINNLCR